VLDLYNSAHRRNNYNISYPIKQAFYLAPGGSITRQTVSFIDKGKYNSLLKLFLQICYAVDAKVDGIFRGEDYFLIFNLGE